MHWVRDEPKVRGYHGQKLLVKRGDKSGVFLMHVHEAAPDGERRPGFVILTIQPDDLNSAINCDDIYAKLKAEMS